MVTYKLIKNYPQFEMPLECRSVADGGYYTNKGDRVYNPEDYPEFWQKVEEKEYQILSITNSYKDIYYLEADNKYHFRNLPISDQDKVVNKDKLKINGSGFDIHSVKRLSDGEIFTIGDKIDWKSHKNHFTVFEIKLFNDVIEIVFSFKGSAIQLSSSLQSISKAKPVLFVTEDFFSVFEGDLVYILYPPYNNTKGALENPFKVPKDWKPASYQKTYYSKEVAQEFILMNKPILSVKEICAIIGQCNNTTYIDLDQLTEKLKKLVKSRL